MQNDSVNSSLSQLENRIVFKVFGLDSIPEEFKTGLMDMLDKRLTDVVVEVLLKNVIGRKNKLTLDDVRFIQPAGAPVSFQLTLELTGDPCTRSFLFYLTQHLTHL